uniref:Putative ovule protein n=1 Tax=Solanum chacoense TaxID=4108 RepID=A0A0V0IJE2_SOLCH
MYEAKMQSISSTRKENNEMAKNYVARTVRLCCHTRVGPSRNALCWRIRHTHVGVFKESVQHRKNKFGRFGREIE